MINLILLVLLIAGMAKVFQKAGEDWWAAIIPIYNFYLLVKVARMSVWWFWASFVPLVAVSLWGLSAFISSASGGGLSVSRLLGNIMPIVVGLGVIAVLVAAFLVPTKISRLFGHGIGMSLGLIFLPFIFYPILGFGKSQYQPLQAQTPPILPTPMPMV